MNLLFLKFIIISDVVVMVVVIVLIVCSCMCVRVCVCIVRVHANRHTCLEDHFSLHPFLVIKQRS